MLWFASALAADGTAPGWPADAVIQVTRTELPVDPLETPGVYTLDLAWPAATDETGVVAYELTCNGEPPLQVAVTTWSRRVIGERRCLLVALDDAGNRSVPLRATSAAVLEARVLGALGGSLEGSIFETVLTVVAAGPVTIAWVDASGALTAGPVSDAMHERLERFERCATDHPVAEKVSVMVTLERSSARKLLAPTVDPAGPLGLCLSRVAATMTAPAEPFRVAIGLEVR